MEKAGTTRKEKAMEAYAVLETGGKQALVKVGAPYVEGAKVTLAVDAVKRGEKVINFKRKRRKGYRRTVGHRQQLTVATVKAIA